MDSLSLTLTSAIPLRLPLHCDILLLFHLRPPIKSLSLNPQLPKTQSFRLSCSSNSSPNPTVKTIRTAASAALVLSAAYAALLSGRPPAHAVPVQETTTETVTETVELSSETVDSLKSLVYQKLEEGEDSEALTENLGNSRLARASIRREQWLNAKI